MIILKILIVITITSIGIVIIGTVVSNTIKELQADNILLSISGVILTLGIVTGLFAMVFAIIKYIP